MTNELRTILFLHVLLALLLVGGAFAFVILYLRARGAESLAELRTTLGNARLIERRMIVPAAVLVGLVGFLLAGRYDAKGIFDAAEATWMHIASTLWIILLVAGFFLGRGVDRALAQAEHGGEGDLATVKARLGSPAVAGLMWLNVALGLVILYLMVFQP